MQICLADKYSATFQPDSYFSNYYQPQTENYSIKKKKSDSLVIPNLLKKSFDVKILTGQRGDAFIGHGRLA